MQWVANEEPPELKTNVEELTKTDGNTTSYSRIGIMANARIRVKQDVDVVLKNIKLKNLGKPHDEEPFTTDPLYKHCKSNEDRIFLEDGILFRKSLEKRVASNITKFSSQSS